MTSPTKKWVCPNCSAEVDAGFEVCWACGTNCDGTPDPNFEVATAPIAETDDVGPPSALVSFILVLCLPATIIYGLVKLAFPRGERGTTSIVRSLLLLGPKQANTDCFCEAAPAGVCSQTASQAAA